MSCEIKRLATIVDLEEVRDILGFSNDENWLNSIYYSLSPTGELFVAGHGSKLVFLSARWDNDTQQNRYSISWKGELENTNDIITSIICLPIVGQSHSIQSIPEWTCIAIGLASGYIQFYTDFGLEIFSQQWHNEPVQGIRAQSGRKINEELHIMFLSCFCVLQGSQLFQLTKTIKHNLQKNKSSQLEAQEIVACRKWSFGGKNVAINDAVVVGTQKICSFDHLLHTSLENGFHSKYKSAPSQNSLVIGVGVKPYIGFHWAKEGFVQPVLADVARAVASKIKSALPTWLTGTQTQSSVESIPQVVTPEPMNLRYGICDIQRTGLSVWIAPGNRFAAVADNLGRIILVDCVNYTAIRIWKGYRDAQCSFVKSTEKVPKTSDQLQDRRHALFLVIFAPRRSSLEIWCLQQGPKVAAFLASKTGQLIYNTHTLMGVSGTSVKVKYNTNTCIFLDPSDQSLKEITIPFHCSLSDSNSKAAKDLHLFRRIKMCLRSGDGSDEEILSEISISCRSFQTDEIRLQCLEMLAKNNKVKPSIFKAALEVFREQMKEEIETDSNEPEDITRILRRNQLNLILINYEKITNFYLYVTNVSIDNVEKNDESIAGSDDNPVFNINETLQLTDSELDSLQRLIDLTILERSSQNCPKVTFHQKVLSNSFVDFLSAFNCNTDDTLCLKISDPNKIAAVGLDIFGNFLEKGKSLENFLDEALKCNISSDEFMKLFLCYWLDKPFGYTKIEDLITDSIRFTSILKEICAIESDKVKYEYSMVSLWWQNVREMLLESSAALMSLLAAIMCRNHSACYRQRENSNDENSSSTEEDLWEQVSQEAAQWSLLIGKLDDIAALGAILGYSKPCQECILPILPYQRPDISLKAIVSGGKGIVSELVSKWIASSGIDPIFLLEEVTSITGSDREQSASEECISFLNYLDTLRKHFPFSTQSGIILSHLAWEYMCLWSNNMTNLNFLVTALRCLNTIKKTEYALKHGLCCMIWNAHLKIPLEATKKLINKTGRLPKEKLCQQDIGLSDFLVPEFLDLCITFLRHFSSSLNSEKMNLRFEELLQDGQIPLSLLALQQNLVNSDLLNLHMELCEILHMIAALCMKFSKPIQNLFDAMSNESFFIEINRQINYSLPKPDLVLQKKRIEFLCLAITTTMDLIREDIRGTYLNEHKFWIKHIEDIANKWELDLDQLRRHQVVELYIHGWDQYAEEQLQTVVDVENAGLLLLKVAGGRLKLLAQKSPTAYAQVASIGPMVIDYLDTISDHSLSQISHTSHNNSLNKLINLTGQVFNCLSHKDSKELRLAGQLVDACAFLKENIVND